MSPTSLLLVVLGVFVVARVVTKDSAGETLAGRLAGNQPSSSSTSSNLITSAAGAPAIADTSTATGGVTQSELQTIAQKMGWNSSQISAWASVISRESGGNPQAVNKASGAAGIAQFIDGFSEYFTYGGNPNTVTGQLTAMANYIKQRYGTPEAALAHENSQGWY